MQFRGRPQLNKRECGWVGVVACCGIRVPKIPTTYFVTCFYAVCLCRTVARKSIDQQQSGWCAVMVLRI